MGYTHYFPQQRPFTDSEWQGVLDDSEKAIAFCLQDGIELAEEYNSTQPALLSFDEIRFNGVDEEGHETFSIERDMNHGFNFCKTARKPYDLAVCLVLLVCNHHAPGTLDIGSDGEWDKEWRKPREIFQMLFHSEAECPWSKPGAEQYGRSSEQGVRWKQ
jgi:hypothetical protein